MPKKVYVVTGGNGYIGSHMCKLLCKMGHEVHIIDNGSTSSLSERHPYGIYHSFDISDAKEVQALFSSISVECLFHFAARSLVGESEENPLLYYRENVYKTLALLESCVAKKVKNFVFSSTCAVFGNPQTDKMKEDHPQIPTNTYGRTKMLIEAMMRDLAGKKLMNVLIFRYFNASGCDPEGELGEDHDPETHLIPVLCKSYLQRGRGREMKKFMINGRDYPTPDGTCIRDFIHVEDLVAAHYVGAGYLNKHPGLHDFNLGTEKGFSVQEVVQIFEKITGEKLDVEYGPRRPGDPHILIGDSQKAKRELGFECKFQLEDSLRHTLNWLKKRN